ncbi:MAG: 1-deoxy-D-xylulose-5-phosphate reductoisomerase [Candidatus Eisenbacteria bacterium]|nr:1-deoxy-D-xylulose-5-phosphate reductoisomerase [Candidatus Eisenbacteria bacterium]
MNASASSTSRPRRVTVLGSTGSIGRGALDVVSRLPDRLEVFGLSAQRSIDLLAEQTLRFQPRVVALADSSQVGALRERLGSGWRGELLSGPDASEQLAGLSEADVVLNGLVGAAGLLPTRAALRAGRAVALANKESLVIAGAAITREADRAGVQLLPVDSEHSGIFQLLQGAPTDGRGGTTPPARLLRRMILTASGGPFRTRDLSTFASIRPEEALKHPTWAMGPRITIDSATLLNKGFELLEAHWLFRLPPEQIEVWVHPQSIVHGLVEWADGSTTAQLSLPDMRIPIQIALCHPERCDAGLPGCDLTRIGRLEFEAPEESRYPCLGLARRALAEGGTAPAVLNAADEVIVQAFLDGRISFPEIAETLERVLDQRPSDRGDEVEQLLEADAWARQRAAAILVLSR